MSATSSISFSFFGRKVKDEYGCTLGRVISILINVKDSSEHVLTELANGNFISYPSIWFKPEGDELILLSPLKLKAEELIETIPLIWRKNQILEEISEKSLSSEELNKIDKNFKEEFNRLKSEAQIILKDIGTKIKKYDLQVKDLNSAAVYLEIEYGINRIDREHFLESNDMIRKGRERLKLKIKDLEQLQKKLRNVMIGEELEFGVESSIKGRVSSKQEDTKLVVRIKDLSSLKT